MKYVFLTLGIEAILFLVWIIIKAKQEIKEEESQKIQTWNLCE
jgi:hypothetical protein